MPISEEVDVAGDTAAVTVREGFVGRPGGGDGQGGRYVKLWALDVLVKNCRFTFDSFIWFFPCV